MGEMQRWQLMGTAPESYAAHLVPAIFEPWAPIVLDIAQLHEGQSVLDVACGTGSGTVRFDSIQEFIGYQCAGSPLATHVNLRDDSLLARIAEMVASVLGSPMADEPVEFPIEAHVAHAQRSA